MAQAAQDQTTPKFRFHRICRLEECDIEFDTNYKQKLFCCTDHQQEWWKRQRAKESGLLSLVAKQGQEIETLKEQIKELTKK